MVPCSVQREFSLLYSFTNPGYYQLYSNHTGRYADVFICGFNSHSYKFMSSFSCLLSIGKSLLHIVGPCFSAVLKIRYTSEVLICTLCHVYCTCQVFFLYSFKQGLEKPMPNFNPDVSVLKVIAFCSIIMKIFLTLFCMYLNLCVCGDIGDLSFYIYKTN